MRYNGVGIPLGTGAILLNCLQEIEEKIPSMKFPIFCAHGTNDLVTPISGKLFFTFSIFITLAFTQPE